jgi:hypothetical protein
MYRVTGILFRDRRGFPPSSPETSPKMAGFSAILPTPGGHGIGIVTLGQVPVSKRTLLAPVFPPGPHPQDRIGGKGQGGGILPEGEKGKVIMNADSEPRNAGSLGRLLAALLCAGSLVGCDTGIEPKVRPESSPALTNLAADPGRVADEIHAVTARAEGAGAPDVQLTQVGFVRRPSSLPESAGATSTDFHPGRLVGHFATVYNTAGSEVGGAISTMTVRRGRLRVLLDVKTQQIDFAEARIVEAGLGTALMAAGTAVLGGSLDISSEAVFVYSDLLRTVNVFDLPSGWVMGFDTSPQDPDLIVAATAPTGSLNLLDPLDDSGSYQTIVTDQPAFLGLAAGDHGIYVTDATGSIRRFAETGHELATYPLDRPLNGQERAEVSVCAETMVVGAHGNGVLLRDGGGQAMVAPEFGLGASILADCSAFAATTEGAVIVGLAGEDGYHIHTLTEVNGAPLPYANSVEILRLGADSPVPGGSWGIQGKGMLLIVVSSARGTHFIDVRLQEG